MTPSVSSSLVPARLVVLASGSGTTLQAVLDAFAGQVVAAGTDRPGCAAMGRARAAGIATFDVAVQSYPDRDAWNEAFATALSTCQPDLAICAGFMRVLGPAPLRCCRFVNTHPSLLPAFPGAHAIRDALAYGVRVSGVTVHLVDSGVDTGPILAQQAVPVRPDDDEESLRTRIQAAEKPLYVHTLRTLIGEIET